MKLSTMSKQDVFRDEYEFQGYVVREAHVRGLSVFHSSDSRNDIGFGYPDLTVAGPGGVAFIELKSPEGVLRRSQKDWATVLKGSGQIHRIWTEDDLESGEIEELFDWLAIRTVGDSKPPVSKSLENPSSAAIKDLLHIKPNVVRVHPPKKAA